MLSSSFPHPCSRRGFTLVEVLVTITIILVLAGLVVGVSSGLQRRGEVAKAEGELATLAAALDTYKAQHGDYPWVGSHAVDGASAVTNANLLYQSLMGYRSPIGGKVLRAGTFENRVDPLEARPGRAVIVVTQFDVGPKEGGDPVDVVTIAGGTDPDKSNHALLDPWGRPYVYVYRSESAPAAWRAPGFRLFSLGPDGLTGTVGGADPVGADGAWASGTPADGAEDNLYHGRP